MLPWEAVCLIPFCDERKFIEKETMELELKPLTMEEVTRNTISFTYKGFVYSKEIRDQLMTVNLALKQLKPVILSSKSYEL